MVTTDDLYHNLGHWKEILVLDLKSAIYHNHMHPDAQPYLGIMTSFGGLQVFARPGHILRGQSEELDELLSKILKDKVMEGIITKMQDDLIIGGANQREATHNYIRILYKFYLVNLKIKPEKTKISQKAAMWRTGSGRRVASWMFHHIGKGHF